MSMSEAFAWCAAEVRRVDYDRYLSVLFAPEPARKHLFALYAVNHEIAKTAEMAREPLAGAIRLQWWRETMDELYAGKPRRHEAVLALAETLGAHDLPRGFFDALIDAREHDFEETPFSDMAALEAYADATSGNVMRLAMRILGVDATFDSPAREAGIAYALTGLLRALPFRSARRNLVLPLDMLTAAGVNTEDVFAGRTSAVLNSVMQRIASEAQAHLHKARASSLGAALPALLPASLCPLYLRVMTRASFDPFRDSTHIAVFRRQLTMLFAKWRGRI